MHDLSKVIVALDTDTVDEAIDIVNSIGDEISFYKIGSIFLDKKGPQIIEKLKSKNKKIFLDLKFHDIPNTVKNLCYQSALREVDMMTIHISGGKKMMEYALNGIQKTTFPSKIIGVSVITSLSQEDLQEDLKIKQSIDDYVPHLCQLAFQSGLHGVVCSPLETKKIRSTTSDDFIIVNPGIRFDHKNSDDQKRITTPQEAFSNGASYIVIGRAITQEENKSQAISKLKNNLGLL